MLQHGVNLLFYGLLLVSLGGCWGGSYLLLPTEPLGGGLNSLAREESPQFSYDGRYLVFVSDRPGYRAIFLFDVAQRQLIPLPGLNRPGIVQDQPSISGDGRYIAFRSEARGRSDIVVYDRLTRQQEIITATWQGEVQLPAISGDGRFVTFQSDRNGQWNIEIYDRGVRSPLPVAPDSLDIN
ncbi:TolB family protein [Parathermosynechococcus lividus]